MVPLVLDALAIRVLFTRAAPHAALRDALLTRWAGESANSLMPAGQIGGPVLVTRHLAARGMILQDGAAAPTVRTHLQTVTPVAFAPLGVSLLGPQAEHL